MTHLTMTEVFLVRSPNHIVEGLMLIMFRGMPSGAVVPHGNLFALKNSSSCGKMWSLFNTHSGRIWQYHYAKDEPTLGCLQAWICVARLVVTWHRISGIFLNISKLFTCICSWETVSVFKTRQKELKQKNKTKLLTCELNSCPKLVKRYS